MLFNSMKGVGGSEYEHHRLQQHFNKRDSISDEVDSDDSKKPRYDQPSAAALAVGKHGGGDGASIEVVRRRRGRPPGSKNKPKPQMVIARDADASTAMRAHVLEIRAGHDVVDAIAGFARRRGIGICVLAGSGAVSGPTLRQPPAATVVLRGSFEILSISATVMPPAMVARAQAGVSVSLAGPQGQVVGGTVAGPLVAAGTVVVVAAAFVNPSFHRLPGDDEEVPTAAVDGSGNELEFDLDRHPQQHHHSVSPPPVAPSADTCGVSIYGLASDVIWAPTAARPPPPPPY